MLARIVEMLKVCGEVSGIAKVRSTSGGLLIMMSRMTHHDRNFYPIMLSSVNDTMCLSLH